MELFFLNIFNFFRKRKLLFWFLALAIFAFVILFGSKISLEEDISKFLPKDPEIANASRVFSEVDVADKLIVNISLSDTSLNAEPETLIRWGETFVDSITHLQPEFISGIQFKTDDSKMMEIWEFVYNSLPYLLDENDYQKIDSLLAAEKITNTLIENKKILVSPAGIVLKKSVAKDPLHISNIILQKFNQLRLQGNYQFFDGCILTPDKKNLLLFIDATNPTNATAKNQVLIDELDKIVTAIQTTSDNKISINYFGGPAVAVSNASQIKRDTYYTSIIAVVLIIILLSVYFKRITAVLYLTVPVLFGVAFSFAAMYFLQSKISAIAIGAGSAVFGIAINYSIHFLTHKQHVNSVRQTIKDIATPMTIGSLTTVGAFLSLMFVSSEALKDFGLFSAFALIGTILFVLVVLPQLFTKKSGKETIAHRTTLIDKIAAIRPEKSGYFVVAIFVLTVFFAFNARNVKFDGEFSAINYIAPNLQKAHNKLAEFTDVDQSPVYCIAQGKTLDEALANHEKAFAVLENLQDENTIVSFTGINNLLPSKQLQQQRLVLWNQFWENRRVEVIQNLKKSGAELGFRESAFVPFNALLKTKFELKEADYFEAFINTFFSNFISVKADKALVYSLLKTNNGGDDTLVNAFKNEKQIVVYDQFYMSKKLVKLLSSDFNFVLFFCGLLVFVFLTLSFGRIELSLISFLPMFISWIWILGLMSLLGLKFNIINIIISTFIFGLGDDFSIFMTEGLMQEYSHKRKSIQSYKTAMILAAITMIIGIGVLVFAKHPAMKSLGAVTLIGMLTVVVLSYTISPFLFKWLTTKSGKLRQTPLTLRNLAKSIYSFMAFFIGSILLNIVGFFMFAFRKNPNPKQKLKYHKILRFVTGYVIKHLPGVDTKVINEHKENFDKPAVIICNHQSHIDLMLTMMLTPKVIILTNQWVWNSPFYGNIVKYLDFYPVASGIEDSVELLQQKVNEGYSILIFPEGTRSVDCSIKRFHKGAFYLAEKFKIDVLPILIHGVGHRVTKGELVLKPGKMRVSILKRVAPDDKSFGENYSKRAKGFRKLYRAKYDEVAREMFTPEYFKHKIIDSYIFKGLATEWYVRLSLKTNNYYKSIISRIPDSGSHLDLYCGKGIFPLLLSMVKTNLNITAFDKNEDDILLANNILTKPDNLNFTCDEELMNSQKYDSVSIVNTLGHLEENIQLEILTTASNQLTENGKLIVSLNTRKSFSAKVLAKIKGESSSVFSVNLNTLISENGFEMKVLKQDGLEIIEIVKTKDSRIV